MGHAQRGVAVLDLLHEAADGVDVVDLLEAGALALHLLVDAVDVLRAALQLGLDAGLGQGRPELVDRGLDEALAALAPGVEELGQLAEAVGLEGLEGQVLELPLHLPDPEPLGQGGVDLHRLAGDALLLVGRQGRQRAHVVEPVGELDEDDPDVLGHGQEHLPDVLGLLLLVGMGAELGQLGHAVDQVGDLRSEALLDVGQVELGVLGDVVEQGRLDGDRVDAQVGQDLGRGDGMGDVRLARRPLLTGVGLDGHVERSTDGLELGLGVMPLQGGQELLAKRLEGPFRARTGSAGRGRAPGARPRRLGRAGRWLDRHLVQG